METIADYFQWVFWITCAVWLAIETYVLYKAALQPIMHYAQRVTAGQLILLTVEVDHNQYLCYNAVTKEFVCQGTDLAELVQRFSTRFPAKTVTIFNGDTTAVATLQQQFRARHENISGI